MAALLELGTLDAQAAGELRDGIVTAAAELWDTEELLDAFPDEWHRILARLHEVAR
jgi:hypothetical protein